MQEWLEREFIESGRLPLFLCFFAFIVTFIVTRTITRMIRSGKGSFGDNVTTSGLHIHHAVPGIMILVIGAFLSVGSAGATGWAEAAGVLVGIGTSLVLDEFALILRLDDVYWAEEGRVSIEVVALALSSLGLILIGANPLAIDLQANATAIASSVAGIVMAFWLVGVTAFKGKYRLALLALFIPPLALVGAIRLAKPKSRWARKHYDAEKQLRATEREQKFDARYGPLAANISDFIAGSPTPEPSDAQAEDSAATG